MQSINLTGNHDEDKISVLAKMYFPRDEAKRKQFRLLTQTNNNLRNSDLEYVVSRDDLEVLLEAPSYEEFVKVIETCVKRGTIVGDLINCIYLMELNKVSEPSLNKAVFIVREFAKTYGVKYGDKTNLPYSEQTIRNYWNEFLPAAHLWGAWRINKPYPYSDNKSVFEEENLNKFLEVAAGIFKFGKSFSPSRLKARKTIFNDDMWTLPSHIIPQKLSSNRFPEQMIHILEKYKALP